MNNALKKFYYGFYTPLPMAESEQEIETYHQQLIERLEKPERKLVLRIMDAQNLIDLWTASFADSNWHGNWHTS